MAQEVIKEKKLFNSENGGLKRKRTFRPFILNYPQSDLKTATHSNKLPLSHLSLPLSQFNVFVPPPKLHFLHFPKVLFTRCRFHGDIYQVCSFTDMFLQGLEWFPTGNQCLASIHLVMVVAYSDWPTGHNNLTLNQMSSTELNGSATM